MTKTIKFFSDILIFPKNCGPKKLQFVLKLSIGKHIFEPNSSDIKTLNLHLLFLTKIKVSYSFVDILAFSVGRNSAWSGLNLVKDVWLGHHQCIIAIFDPNLFQDLKVIYSENLLSSLYIEFLPVHPAKWS